MVNERNSLASLPVPAIVPGIMRTVTFVSIVLAGVQLAACATTPGGVEEAQADRFEGFNRKMYAFNRGLDKAVIRPVTVGYRTAVPAAARRGASNALDNVDEPLSFFNALLQGKVTAAFQLGSATCRERMGK